MELVTPSRFAAMRNDGILFQLGRGRPLLRTAHRHTFFELVIHEMPLRDAENYIREMRAFYTAGWMKIMGQ